MTVDQKVAKDQLDSMKDLQKANDEKMNDMNFQNANLKKENQLLKDKISENSQYSNNQREELK